jgi:hypothetical protein
MPLAPIETISTPGPATCTDGILGTRKAHHGQREHERQHTARYRHDYTAAT